VPKGVLVGSGRQSLHPHDLSQGGQGARYARVRIPQRRPLHRVLQELAGEGGMGGQGRIPLKGGLEIIVAGIADGRRRAVHQLGAGGRGQGRCPRQRRVQGERTAVPIPRCG